MRGRVHPRGAKVEKMSFPRPTGRMNHTGQHTHMAEMLGQEFLGTVVHAPGKGDNEGKVFANLRDDGGST